MTALSGATFQGAMPEAAILDEADETPISDGMPGTASEKIPGIYLSEIPGAGSDEMSKEALLDGISDKIPEAAGVALSGNKAGMPLSADMPSPDKMAAMALSDEMASVPLSTGTMSSSEETLFYNEKAYMPLCNKVQCHVFGEMAVKVNHAYTECPGQAKPISFFIDCL